MFASVRVMTLCSESRICCFNSDSFLPNSANKSLKLTSISRAETVLINLFKSSNAMLVFL